MRKNKFPYALAIAGLLLPLTGCAYLPMGNSPSAFVATAETSETDRARAEAYLAAGEDAKAAEITEAYVTLLPDDIAWRNIAGLLADRAGEHEKAQAIYLAALENKAIGAVEAEYTRNNLALSYLVSGNPRSAIILLKPHVQSAARQKETRQLLALAYGAAGEEDKAYELGLADLSVEEAAENLKFYQQFRADGFKRDVLLRPAS